MKIEVTEEQVCILLDGLNALVEDTLYENKATTDREILESNASTRRAADELFDYLVAQIS